MAYENIKDISVDKPYLENGVWKCEVVLKRWDASIAILHGRTDKEVKKMAKATAYMMDQYYASFGLNHLVTK